MSDAHPTLDIQTRSSAGDPILTLHGDVDMRTSPTLRDKLLQLIQQRPERIVLDLAGVPYMDSSGIGTMVELKRRLDRIGGKLVLAGLQPRVRSLLEITRLDQFFAIVENTDEAQET